MKNLISNILQASRIIRTCLFFFKNNKYTVYLSNEIKKEIIKEKTLKRKTAKRLFFIACLKISYPNLRQTL